MTCAAALGWSFVGITIIGCMVCTGFALAACRLSASISREEEGDIYCAPEGGITRIREIA